MANRKDDRVINALCGKYEEFRKLALMAVEQPATTPYVRAEMARMLETFTPAQRLELRRALVATGKRFPFSVR